MADDPREVAVARAIAEWFEDRGGDPVFLNDGVNERIEPNHAAHEVSIVALAAADEVQAAEVERLRAERDEARRQVADLRARLAHWYGRALVRASGKAAAEARYTALVERIGAFIGYLDAARASGRTWTCREVRDELCALLPATTEEG